MAELWTDFTDAIISSIDAEAKLDGKIVLRELLTDPAKFAKQPEIQNKIMNVKEAVDGYIDQRIKAMADVQKELDDSMAKADTLSSQLAQSISVKAMQSKVPLIKPVAVDRDITKEERIILNSIDTNVSALIDKLVASSTMVADFSTTYNNHKIGEWLFSGPKNYVISVYLERNQLLLMQGSRAEIDALLDAAANFIKGL
ncbi:MAG TPA: hypothetical protein VMV00_01485 [Candidatus Baltobacteraceae bacterium]|nr:hypothetical protein [Candidatus Baltobacteraceae bacterium]